MAKWGWARGGLCALAVACSFDGVQAVSGDDTTSASTSVTGSGDPTTSAGTSTTAAATTDPSGTRGDETGTTTADVPLGPFEQIEAVSELNTVFEEEHATVRSDGLEIFFMSGRPGGPGDHDIWVATRATTADDFGNVQPVTEVSSFNDEGHPQLSQNGLVLMYSSTRVGGPGGRDLYVSTRATTQNPWSLPVLIEGIGTTGDETSAAWSADRLTLTYCSNAGGDENLLTASRPDTMSPLADPQIISWISTAAAECGPWVAANGVDVYFDSDRPEGAGAKDIWHGVAGAQVLSNVAELNTASPEAEPWLSEDGRVIYFTRSFGADSDLFRAVRQPL